MQLVPWNRNVQSPVLIRSFSAEECRERWQTAIEKAVCRLWKHSKAVLLAAEILWCLVVTTSREECQHAGKSSERNAWDFWSDSFSWAGISSSLLVLHLAQQNVDQQQWLLALVVMLAAFLHGVAKWFLHSPNRGTFIKQIEVLHSFVKMQLAASPLAAFLWVLSIWLIFKWFPRFTTPKKTGNQRKIN